MPSTFSRVFPCFFCWTKEVGVVNFLLALPTHFRCSHGEHAVAFSNSWPLGLYHYIILYLASLRHRKLLGLVDAPLHDTVWNRVSRPQKGLDVVGCRSKVTPSSFLTSPLLTPSTFWSRSTSSQSWLPAMAACSLSAHPY